MKGPAVRTEIVQTEQHCATSVCMNHEATVEVVTALTSVLKLKENTYLEVSNGSHDIWKPD